MTFEDLMQEGPSYIFDKTKISYFRLKLESTIPNMPKEKIKEDILKYYVKSLKRLCGKNVNKTKPEVVGNTLEMVKTLTAEVLDLLPDEYELIKRIEKEILGGWKI